jgi:hypothetical protein
MSALVIVSLTGAEASNIPRWLAVTRSRTSLADVFMATIAAVDTAILRLELFTDLRNSSAAVILGSKCRE